MKREAPFVILLCALAMFATWDHARNDAITFDEPPHIYAGAEYVQMGTYFTNPEHPPLAKLLAGWAVREAAPARFLPRTPMPSGEEFLQYFRENEMPFRALLAKARAPFRWLFAALVVVVYLAARHFAGTLAAALAAAVVALEPTLIAHAGIVQTDLPATLFMTATIVLALVARRWMWAVVGVLLGLAILSKFTALILVPLLLLAPLLRKRWHAWPLLACLVAAIVVLGGYTWCMRDMPPRDAARAAAQFLRGRGAPLPTTRAYAQLTYRLPAAGMFLSGVKGVQLMSSGEREGWNFLHGKLSREGFPQYFPIAFAMKSTPALLVLTALALFGIVRYPGLVVPALLLFAVSIPSSFNIGVRHVLPVYPLFAIAGACVVATFRRFAPAVAALIALSAVISLVRIHPHELGYFSFGGPHWVNDSNIDWGQDVYRMQRLLRERGWERDTRVVVFSSVVMTPEISQYRRLAPGPVRPGRYAVSSFMEHVGPHLTRQFEGAKAGAQMQALVDALHTRGTPVAKAGSSITVWEVR